MVDRAVGEAALPERLAVCFCLRTRFFDRVAFDELRLRVAPDLSWCDFGERVLCKEGKEVVDERPAKVGDRLGLEPFLFALREPLGGVFVERRFLERCADSGLVPRRLPDPSADIREHVREFLFGPLPAPAFLARTEGEVVALSVSAEAQCERSTLTRGTHQDLSARWSRHDFLLSC